MVGVDDNAGAIDGFNSGNDDWFRLNENGTWIEDTGARSDAGSGIKCGICRALDNDSFSFSSGIEMVGIASKIGEPIAAKGGIAMLNGPDIINDAGPASTTVIGVQHITVAKNIIYIDTIICFTNEMQLLSSGLDNKNWKDIVLINIFI